MTSSASAQDSVGGDPYVWLEDVDSPRALEWVRAENQRTLGIFQADPRYQNFYQRALEVLEAKDRIPNVVFRAGQLYNFWQDAQHVKGILRRTSLASYRTPNPQWETLLDIDALAKAEGKSWVYDGMSCLPPDERRCLVSLSQGGRDATVVREFDLPTARFVPNGFMLEEAKQFTDWVNQDEILIARGAGDGTMSESGYPIVIKRWRRGQPVAQAVELYRGTVKDVGVFPSVLRDSAGRAHAQLAIRYISTFEQEVAVLGGERPVALDMPKKSQLAGIVDGRVVFALTEPWTTQGANLRHGLAHFL